MVTQGLWVKIGTLRLAVSDMEPSELLEQRRNIDWTVFYVP